MTTVMVVCWSAAGVLIGALLTLLVSVSPWWLPPLLLGCAAGWAAVAVARMASRW